MNTPNKHAKRVESCWNPDKPKRGKTPHDVAVAYAAARWGGYGSREAWQHALRYQGTFTLPRVIT